jgi:hypothetical protein
VVKKSIRKFLKYLRAFHIRKSGFWNAVTLYVCMHTWICISLATEQLHGLYSCSVLRILSAIGRCPVFGQKSDEMVG